MPIARRKRAALPRSMILRRARVSVPRRRRADREFCRAIRGFCRSSCWGCCSRRALTCAAAFAAQRLLDRLTRKSAPSLRSAAITALSLTLLLRADNLWAMPAAAALAIASKFALCVDRKHLFNPANFGIVAALALLPGTWISAGQWGSDVTLAGWMIVAGMTVANRARRADMSLSFLLFYLGALAARVAWLGQRWNVWTHQLTSGALLLFAFFMISDPM